MFDGLALEPLNASPRHGGLRLNESRTEGGSLVTSGHGVCKEAAVVSGIQSSKDIRIRGAAQASVVAGGEAARALTVVGGSLGISSDRRADGQ